MGASVVSVVVLLLVVVTRPKTVSSSASTIIRSPSGWTTVEGSNITFGCWVSQTSNADRGLDADTICRSRIRFTKNTTIVPEDPRHSQSGGTRDGQTNRINCTMTVLRIQSGDSGYYGCCWPNVEGNCSRHPTRILTVLPASTRPAPTTTPVIHSSSNMLTGRTTPSESNEVVYQSISLRSGPTVLAGGKNEAFKQRSSIHKTVWPLLLVIAVLVVIIIFGKRYVKRKAADGHPVSTGDPESAGHLDVQDHSCTSHELDGAVAIATTTTTTTTTVLNRNSDEESLR